MPYLGNAPSATFQSVAYQDLTGGTGTSFTLSHAVSSAQELEVFVNNVRQEPTVAYTVAGTTLTMTGTIAATDDFYVVFQGKAVGSVSHPTTSPLAATTGTFSGAVTATSFTGDGSALTGVGGGAGSIAQVKFTQLTTDSTLSLSAKTDTVVTGFTVNITPTSTSSIIKCEAMWMGEMLDTPNTYSHMFFFYADTTKLGYTGTAGNRNYGVAPATRTYSGVDNAETPDVAYLSFFHNPNTTSQVTYKLGINVDTADTLYINRTINSTDVYNNQRGTSFICVTEILQ